MGAAVFGIRLPSELSRCRGCASARCRQRINEVSSALERVEYEGVDLSEKHLEVSVKRKGRYHSCARARWKDNACSDLRRTDSGIQGHEMMDDGPRRADGHGGVMRVQRDRIHVLRQVRVPWLQLHVRASIGCSRSCDEQEQERNRSRFGNRRSRRNGADQTAGPYLRSCESTSLGCLQAENVLLRL